MDALNVGPAPGLVYFIRAGQSKMVKIGWTADLRVRLSGLQSGNDRPLRVLLALPGDRSFEAELHSQFHRWRRIGEWFWLDASIMRFVADHLPTCAWRSDPTKARFMATPRSLPMPRNRRAVGVRSLDIGPNLHHRPGGAQ
jgi:hypothetical protein